MKPPKPSSIPGATASLVSASDKIDQTLRPKQLALREEVRNLEASLGPDTAHTHENNLQMKAAYRVDRATREARLPEALRELKLIDQQIQALELDASAARKTARENADKSRVEMQGRAGATLASAMAGCKTLPALQDARAKLTSLRQQEVAAERELSALDTEPPRAVDNVQANAQAILETGALPEAPSAHPDTRRSHLSIRIRALHEAVRLQERVLRKAGEAYIKELRASLRPAQQALAGQIINALESAYLATAEDDSIREAFLRATADIAGFLPSLRYPGLTQRFHGAPGGFEAYLERLNREGFSV